MNDLDPQKLQSLRRTWRALDLDARDDDARLASDMARVREDLAALGLDLVQDATYELLEDGLGRGEFDRRTAVAAVRGVIAQYNFATGATQNGWVGAAYGRRYAGLTQLVDYNLPEMKQALAALNLPRGAWPADLSALDIRQAQMITDAADDHILTVEIKRAALGAAHDYFRAASGFKKAVDITPPSTQGDQVNMRTLKEGLSYATQTLKMIDAAASLYTPQDITAEHARAARNAPAQLAFSREAAAEIQRFFRLRTLGVQFQSAAAFQEREKFVLDASGGGHGALVMPMQDIAHKLQEYGMDLRDRKTYDAIGTDIDEFWLAYRRERRAVMDGERHKNLIKPELRP